jgi:hypothetical protein
VTLYGTGSSPKIEALIDGTWTDVTSRVRGDAQVSITRGRVNEQARTTAQTCNLTFENQDGYFSTRDPSSVNYGLIPKNTQLRVSAGSGDLYLRLPYNDSGDLRDAITADKAVLDITGDIDVRMEVWPHTWRPPVTMTFMAKYSRTADQRSWALYINSDGTLVLVWSTAGTSGTRIFATSTVAVPESSGRLAIRATLDVDNGAGGNTVAFYTSDSITGSWTALGSSVVTAGTTSIFSSSASLTVGGAEDFPGATTPGLGLGGKVYKAQVYNGIAGTLVANMDATAQTIDTISWSDGLGTPNTWFLGLTTDVAFSTDRLRFWGELSSLPKRWDETGSDVFVPAVASGMIRRLTQGATPTHSAMYRNFTQYTPHGYWPFEDDFGSVRPASAVAGGTAAVVTGVTFASATDLPGSERTLAFTDATGRIDGVANAPTNTGTASFVFYVKLSSLPATQKTFCSLITSGTARRIEIGIDSTNWHIDFFDSLGASLGGIATSITTISPVGQWVGYNLLLQTSGSNMTYSQRWDVVGGIEAGTGPTTITTASVRPFSVFTLQSSNDAAFNDAQFGHVFMSTQNLDLATDAFRNASNAYLGETAVDRIIRLSIEENLPPFEITGMSSDSEPMGFQTTNAVMDLIYECWDADGGIGGEARDQLTLTYRTRVDLERRTDVTLSYSSSQLSEVPEPTDDDLGTVNDATVQRTGGSSARSVVGDGPNSILDPPLGIGRYNTQVTLNVQSDDRLPSIAGWMTLVGSWDQERYPSVAEALHRTELTGNATLTAQVMALDLGDTLVLADLPSWMTPDDVPELVQGYTETLSKFLWDVTYNCTPAGPYRSVTLLGSSGYPPRLDATTHTIGGTMTTTATSVTFVTAAGSARWVDSATYAADFPFDVVIAGEVMTVTAMTGTSSPQTATLTRSVNGVVKAHSSGEAVRLAKPYYIGR